MRHLCHMGQLPALGVLLISAFAAGPVCADGPLRLTVSAQKAFVALGEPVTIVATVTNVGADMEPLVQDLSLEAGIIQYRIRDSGGEVRRYEPLITATIGATPTALYPSEQICATHLLVWGAHGRRPFPTPGEYAVIATYADPTHLLYSAPLTVVVSEPQGEDAQALPAVFDDESSEFLAVQSYQLRRGISLLTDLLRDFPRTSYAPYAAYALAWRASKPGYFCAEPGSGKLERVPARYGDAVAAFQRVVRDWPDSVVADDAQYELARTYHDAGNVPAASNALVEFMGRFGATSDRLADAVKLSEQLGWESASAPRKAAPEQWASLREAADASAARATWMAGSGAARVTRGRLSVEIRPGRPTAVVGKRRIPLTAPPRLEGERLMVPASFAALLPRLLREGRTFDPVPAGGPVPALP